MFLRDLTEHATQPQFVYRHRWQTDDLVMWDNRTTCIAPGGSTEAKLAT